MHYALDAIYEYSHLSQGDEEPTTQYLSRAKVLLEHIHHTKKVVKYSRCRFGTVLYLVRGLKALYMRRRVVSKQDF